jgi:enoyl-CoA hydratase/carnithine racemase
MNDEQRVLIDVADHVATVTLNRPDKHNALDGAMFQAIPAAADEVANTPGVRAVVIHGAGKSFCSGLDVASLASGPISLDDILQRNGHRANIAQRVATDWIDVPVPVIAAIHGNCFGGGLQLALGADIRFAAPDAKLAVMESKWGLVPDMGITSTLPRLVPIDVAKELTFTARILSGEEAKELGLVTHVADDPLAAAQELAREIAQRSPDAVRAAKKLYDEAWVAPAEEALKLETDLQVKLIGSPNQIAAVTAGMTKQPAEFADPS